MFGNPETTTGGNALKFYASVRLDVRRTGAIKKGEDVLGNDTKVKVVKNKMAPPFKLAKFSIMYGEGVSHVGEVVDMGVEFGHVKKSGAWYAVGTERIGQGRDNAIQYLKDHPDMINDIEGKVREELGLPEAKVKAVAPSASED